MNEDGLSNIAYFRLDGGSSKLYTQEYVDKKDKEIERLNKMLDEKFMKENTFLVENGIICKKNKEIDRLTKVEKEHQRINGELREENKKLNNIIEAIEKALKDNIEELKDLTFSYDRIYEDKEILKLIQELKGSDKHE